MEQTFADLILRFYDQLHIDAVLPDRVTVLNPYPDPEVRKICEAFYRKYYNDNKGRKLILGINPGRFGAGVTGIPFTDPVRLEKNCRIRNNFAKRGELSSEFIYTLIDKMGGPDHFYAHYYIGAVSPLGFVKDNKNFNYYDSPQLIRALKPFITESLVRQIGLGIKTRECFVLGQGKNIKYLEALNKELRLFDRLIPLPHPRWVMQYRRKQLDDILLKTIRALKL